MTKSTQDLEMCQRQADEVKVLMKDNVEKVIEREGKLSELEGRSADLLNLANKFQKTSKTVERHTRWQKWRCYVIFGGIVLLVVVILIIVIVILVGGGGSSPEQAMQKDPN
ncbi:vesicle-associated membrane protein 5 [Spea bombifrons]|uniref:vesicle-associated membrane protein 5 n=1 Tax=Spea bombifrons TaxID=233779 RepID=UPI00234BC25C|nr:vesicle-associated membrane protein 5 [Spea bombifrons]